MKPKKQIDFLEHCLAEGYSEEEIKQAFIEIKDRNDSRLLVYFINSQKSDNLKVRKLAKDLSSVLSPNMLWSKLPYLAKCQRSGNKAIADLATQLIRYIMAMRLDSEIIEKLDYFISSQRAKSINVRKFASNLVSNIDNKELAKRVDVLISYSHDKNPAVREFTREYAIKVLRCCALNDYILSIEEIEKHFDFIMSCAEIDNKEITFQYARELSLILMGKWPTLKLTSYLEYLLTSYCKLSDESQSLAMELLMRVIATWPYQKRKEKLALLLQFWRNVNAYNHKTKPMSLDLALGIIRYFPKDTLPEYIDALIACQEFSKLKKLSRHLALKIKNEDLVAYEYKINNYLKKFYNFSNYHVGILAIELKLKLMSSWSSKELADNLSYIFICHDTPEKRLRLRAKKLAARITPEDLTGKALEIITLALLSHKNDNLIRNLEMGLQLKINPNEFLPHLEKLFDDRGDLKKYEFFKKITFQIAPKEFDVNKLFKLRDGYHELGKLLALRTMKNWNIEQLKPYTNEIFDSMYINHNKDAVQLAERLYGKIKDKEFSIRRISKVKQMIIVHS